MKLIIHDLDEQMAAQVIAGVADAVVLRDDGNIRRCIGCFGCWVKTPGRCVLGDSYCDLSQIIARSDEIIIISRCMYGCYSPFVRNVLDRFLPFLLPYLAIYENEMHHRPRYKKHKPVLSVYFYGEDIQAAEQETARKLVAANAKNFHSLSNQVTFVTSPKQLEGSLA